MMILLVCDSFSTQARKQELEQLIGYHKTMVETMEAELCWMQSGLAESVVPDASEGRNVRARHATILNA